MSAELYKVVDLKQLTVDEFEELAREHTGTLTPQEAFYITVKSIDTGDLYDIIIITEHEQTEDGDSVINLIGAYDTERYKDKKKMDELMKFALAWFENMLKEAVKRLLQEEVD